MNVVHADSPARCVQDGSSPASRRLNGPEASVVIVIVVLATGLRYTGTPAAEALWLPVGAGMLAVTLSLARGLTAIRGWVRRLFAPWAPSVSVAV